MAELSQPLATEAEGSSRPRAAARLAFARRSAETSRYSSRLVVLLKLLLPAVALSLVGLIVLWPQLRDDPGQFRIGTAKIDPSEADSLRMVSPRYAGVDSENQPFALLAASATQVAGSNGDVMQLVEPKADLSLKDGSWVAVSAPAGIYDRLRQTVHLSGGVSIFQDSGYAFFTPSADVDLIVGTASGDDPVEGQGPLGHLTAAGFRVLDRGHRVVFLGQSHLTLTSDNKASEASKAAPPPPPARATGPADRGPAGKGPAVKGPAAKGATG
jgi:lipopolysaccharide export system protein LptC